MHIKRGWKLLHQNDGDFSIDGVLTDFPKIPSEAAGKLFIFSLHLVRMTRHKLNVFDFKQNLVHFGMFG